MVIFTYANMSKSSIKSYHFNAPNRPYSKPNAVPIKISEKIAIDQIRFGSDSWLPKCLHFAVEILEQEHIC